MTVQMIGRELDEIVRELYVLPPADFVAARNELVRQARRTGNPEVAERLQQLRRPTRSAWLVNLLASDSAAMQRLSGLGRQLRDAQTGLAGEELRSLSQQRRQLINDMLQRAQIHADEAGVRLTATVISEVEATLQAALVDLAGAMTVRNGRLVRPLSHSGFGPRPRLNIPRSTSGAELRPVEVPSVVTAETERPPVEDELAARRRTAAERKAVELVGEADRSPAKVKEPGLTLDAEPEGFPELRRAVEALAAAEAAHWQAEFELADAEGAMDAAIDRLNSLDTQRIEARRDKVTAQRYLAEAQTRQRDAVNALADARRHLDVARQSAGGEE
jgi:hypothetical protein